MILLCCPLEIDEDNKDGFGVLLIKPHRILFKIKLIVLWMTFI